MMNKLPFMFDKYKICIICEGNEEYEYLHRLISLRVWNRQYEIKLVNANGNGNIPARYQDRYQNGFDDAVLIFCDTEKKPYEQYTDIKRKINEFHGLRYAHEKVILFGNPCTMQIIIKHWSDSHLSTPSKRMNQSLLYQCTGIENYKGRKDQLKQMMKLISADNYTLMKDRISRLSRDDTVVGSSNFIRFIEYFESDDSSWIDEWNQCLE